MKEGCYAVSKLLTLVLNVVFLIIGVYLIIIGIFSRTYGDLSHYISTPTISYSTIAIGGVIFIISFLGFCGSYKESIFCLILYTVVLMLIVGALVFVSYEATYEYKHVRQLVKKAWDEMDPKEKRDIEEQFICCGFYRPDKSQFCEEMVEKHPNITGCFKKLENFLSSIKLRLLKSVALCLGVSHSSD